VRGTNRRGGWWLRAIVLVLSAAVLGPVLVPVNVLVLGTPDTTLLGRVAGEGNEPAGRVHRVIG
jgi:hypothetical protein